MTLQVEVLKRETPDPLDPRHLELFVSVGGVSFGTKVYGSTWHEVLTRFVEALGGLVRGARP